MRTGLKLKCWCELPSVFMKFSLAQKVAIASVLVLSTLCRYQLSYVMISTSCLLHIEIKLIIAKPIFATVMVVSTIMVVATIIVVGIGANESNKYCSHLTTC